MNQKLTGRNTLIIGTMLFGLFFGAGNLIFPIHLGQLSGRSFTLSTIGFMITAVGLPFLCVLALSMSQSDGVFQLSKKVNTGFARFFTTILYLTIGPLFALPRLAAVSFEVALSPYLNPDHKLWFLILFSLCFYSLALYLCLSKRSIMDVVGKVITPVFLILLGSLLLFALINPMGSLSSFDPVAPYDTHALFSSFIDGYQTMDALAALAFGIVVVDALKNLGVTNTKAKSFGLLKAGIVSSILMLVLYVGLMYLGASSRGVFEIAENGGITLAQVVNHYFKQTGHIVVAAIITLGCLKTAIGLISASSQTFNEMSDFKLSKKSVAYAVTGFSAFVAVFGLNIIIEFAVPMLMFIYPLTIALTILGIITPLLPNNTSVYKTTIGLTFIASTADLLASLPANLQSLPIIKSILTFFKTSIPFFNLQLGWIGFVVGGLLLGFIIDFIRKKHLN